MGKKLPELRVERILLTGHGLGGELFFVGRAAQVGGRGAWPLAVYRKQRVFIVYRVDYQGI